MDNNVSYNKYSFNTGELTSIKELYQSLENSSDLEHFLSDNQPRFRNQSIGALISAKIWEHKVTKSFVAKKAGISWVYLYQILTDKRHPSRNRVICIGLALPCSLPEMQQLLFDCGYAELDIRSRRDSIILYGVLHEETMDTVNDNLFSAGEETLN